MPKTQVASQYVIWLLLLFFIGPPLPCSASDEASSTANVLLGKGLQLFRGEQYKPALKLFHKFVTQHPRDHRGYLFRGLTLNRLHSWRLALNDLLRAEQLGTTFSRLPPEIAWAAVEAGVPSVALSRLEPYLEFAPSDANAHALLGRVWLIFGNLDAAEAEFHRALELDVELEPTVRLYMATLEQKRGNERAAAENIAGIMLRHPQSRMSLALGEAFPEMREAVKQVKPWRAELTVGLGNNDNVIALPDGFALPEDISSRDSMYRHVAFSGTWNLLRTADRIIAVGYNLDTMFNNQVENFDVIDQFVFVNAAGKLRDDLTAAVMISDEFTIVDDSAYRNETALRPSLVLRWHDGIMLEGAYRFAKANYFRNTAPENDRDERSHSLSVTGYFDLPVPGNARLTTGYVQSWSNTDGSNFDADTDSLRIGVRAELPWSITGNVILSRTWDDYDNPNTLSIAGDKRRDSIDRLSVHLTRPVTRSITAFLNFNRTIRDANIPFFEYDQNRVEAGLKASF